MAQRLDINALLKEEKKENKDPNKKLTDNFATDIVNLGQQLEKEKERQGSNCYKPSSLNCFRQMFYMRTEAEKDPYDTDYQLSQMANVGSWRHENIQNILTEMNNRDYRWEYVNVADYIKEKQKITVKLD